MVILLSYTLESQAAHEVQRVLNTPQQQSFIEPLSHAHGNSNNRMPEIRDYLVDIVKQHPEVYGEGVGDEWARGNFNTFIIQTAQDQTLMTKLSFCFEMAFERLFVNIIQQLPVDQKILLIYPVMSYKPQGVDHFIGWAVREQDYGIDHMDECEHIGEEAAIILSNTHNDWMRTNQQCHDKFFDQTSGEDVLQYIRGL